MGPETFLPSLEIAGPVRQLSSSETFYYPCPIMIRTGDVAPDFQAPSSTGATLRLSEHRGKHVVLYFFPKAFTAG